LELGKLKIVVIVAAITAGVALFLATDWDDDGLANIRELQYGTSMFNSDTDGDGLNDGVERIGWSITVDGLAKKVSSDPLARDPDGDGLSDREEYEIGTDPKMRDTDGDGLGDLQEVGIGTSAFRSNVIIENGIELHMENVFIAENVWIVQDNHVIKVENIVGYFEVVKNKRWISKKVNENLEIAVSAPEYLSMSTFEDRVPNPVEVYARRTGSAGWLKVDIEVGIKIRFQIGVPPYSVHVFVDVDLEVLGRDYPDFREFDWQICPAPGAPTMTLADLEEGYVGVVAYGVPSEELGEGIEITALDEETWECVGSENIYVLKDSNVPERVQLSFPLDVTIGPLEAKE